MLSKQQLTFLRSRQQKKFRQMYGKFLVEGDKLVNELLGSNFKVDAIYSVQGWKSVNPAIKAEHHIITEAELQKVSTHDTPNKVIAVAEMPLLEYNNEPLKAGLYIVLDKLQDPGNAGAIIRIADWFGVSTVFLADGSVDVYNPKVVNSAKGSLFRVQCHYVDLKQLFEANKHLSVYGTFMDGENIYRTALDKDGFIIIGNEGNGISPETEPFVTKKSAIPAWGKAESLNAAVATGIVVSEFRRISLQ
jgi:TrmH family RNA methyltransferase